MQEFWIDFAASVIITTLRAAIKDPGKKATLKAVFRKIYTLIQQAYPEFE